MVFKIKNKNKNKDIVKKFIVSIITRDSQMSHLMLPVYEPHLIKFLLLPEPFSISFRYNLE